MKMMPGDVCSRRSYPYHRSLLTVYHRRLLNNGRLYGYCSRLKDLAMSVNARAEAMQARTRPESPLTRTP